MMSFLISLFFDDYGFVFGNYWSILCNFLIAVVVIVCVCLGIVAMKVAEAKESVRNWSYGQSFSFFVFLFFVFLTVAVGGFNYVVKIMVPYRMPNIEGSANCYRADEFVFRVRDYDEFRRCAGNSDIKIVLKTEEGEVSRAMLTDFPSLVPESMKQKYKQCLDLLGDHRIEAASGVPNIATEMAVCAQVERWRKSWEIQEARKNKKESERAERAAKVQEIKKKDNETRRSLLGGTAEGEK